jgi:hypothetical protein
METEKTITAVQNSGDPFKPTRQDEIWFEDTFGIPWQWAKELIGLKDNPMGEEIKRRINVYLEEVST